MRGFRGLNLSRLQRRRFVHEESYQSQFKSEVEDHGALMIIDSSILSNLHCTINALNSIIVL